MGDGGTRGGCNRVLGEEKEEVRGFRQLDNKCSDSMV